MVARRRGEGSNKDEKELRHGQQCGDCGVGAGEGLVGDGRRYKGDKW